jgi:hypothetical protein
MDETNEATQELINRLIPGFDSEPNLLAPADIERLTNGAIKPQSLAADRCGPRRHGIEFIRVGRKIRYIKASVARWLVQNYNPATV